MTSGPTVADPSTSREALDILAKYRIEVPDRVEQWLLNPESETVKPADKAFANSQFYMIATPHKSVQAAAAAARKFGLRVLLMGDNIEGEAREVAKVHAAISRYALAHGEPITPPCLILSGGETTVTVRGSGHGGRNAEFLLSLAVSLEGAADIYALAADTDGIDGSEDNAGALLSPDSWQRALDLGINPAEMLQNNDGYEFFRALDDLIMTGPTKTNVNDFRAILILPRHSEKH